ncbi:MAG TPA: hypothetical protein VKL22_09960 [Actinomycetota bacterium]|nr:hypothetical protein [Actinomycetota bacterium]
MKLVQVETFVTVRWEAERDSKGEADTFEATLCLRHRKELAEWIPSIQGCYKHGESCDYCEGRGPRKI